MMTGIRFTAPIEWRNLNDAELLAIQQRYAEMAKGALTPEWRAWCRAVSLAAQVERHERSVIGQHLIPYTFRFRGREATVSLHAEGFSVVCSGARLAFEITRERECDAFVVARSWTFAGVAPEEVRCAA